MTDIRKIMKLEQKLQQLEDELEEECTIKEWKDKELWIEARDKETQVDILEAGARNRGEYKDDV